TTRVTDLKTGDSLVVRRGSGGAPCQGGPGLIPDKQIGKRKNMFSFREVVKNEGVLFSVLHATSSRELATLIESASEVLRNRELNEMLTSADEKRQSQAEPNRAIGRSAQLVRSVDLPA